MNTVISNDTAGTAWSPVVLEKPNIQFVIMELEKLCTGAIPVTAPKVAELST
jgi:hypothetical protein